jgi:hypothetical protein
LFVVSSLRAAQSVNSFFVRSGQGQSKKLFGLDRAMGLRKFILKFLDPNSPALSLAGESRLRQR